MFCLLCVRRSNVEWTQATFGVFYTTSEYGKPGNFYAVTLFGFFRGSNIFLLIGVKFPYIFFWKVWLLQKIRSLKFIESFCHNLIFVAVTFSGIYSVLCRIRSLVVGVYGVQLLIQLRPILETFITLGETASLKVFSRHLLWKFSSVKYFFISRINFSNDFLKKMWLQKHRIPRNIESFCHILVFITMCVWCSNMKWTESNFGIFYTTWQNGEPEKFQPVTFFGIGNQSIFVAISAPNIFYDF